MTVAGINTVRQYAKPPDAETSSGLKALTNRRRVGTENGERRCPHFQHLLGRNARGVSVTIHEIQVAVALQCGVTLLDLLSERRGLAFARPRQVAMWLALHLTPRAITEIGRAFGRDHSTVLHGIGRVDAAIAAGDAWGVQAALMKQELAGRMAA